MASNVTRLCYAIPETTRTVDSTGSSPKSNVRIHMLTQSPIAALKALLLKIVFIQLAPPISASSLTYLPAGYLKRPSQLSSPCTSESLESCRDLCLQSGPNCMTFGYAPSNQTCSLMNKSLPKMAYRNKAQDLGGVFYNSHCFRRTCCTDQNSPNVCGQSCTNLQTDDNNCGTCGNQMSQLRVPHG